MKKLLCFLFAVIMVFVLPFALFAQDPSPPSTVPETTGIGLYVVSFVSYLASVLALVEIFSVFFKKENARKWIGWLAAILIGVLAFLLKLGVFFAAWYIGLVYVIIVGLVSNGYLTSEKGQLLVDLIIDWLLKLGKPKTSPPGK
jgi:ABC-type long-subunit fatty acid transport system fused permease/ATPase subunit